MHVFRFSRKTLGIPYALFLLLFVVAPLIVLFYYAFTNGQGQFTIANFTGFFSDPNTLGTLCYSFAVALVTTLVCLMIAYPTAYILAKSNLKKKSVLVMLFIMPMWINFVLRTGATRDVLNWIGIQGGTHPYIATMIGLVYNYLPFTILPLYTTMIKLDKAQIEATRDLGANPVQTFFLNILPQSVPGIVSAAEMVFMPTMSSYVISDTLSEGMITLFGNIIYLNFSQSQWNEGSFMAFIMLLLVGISMLISRRFDAAENRVRGGNLW